MAEYETLVAENINAGATFVDSTSITVYHDFGPFFTAQGHIIPEIEFTELGDLDGDSILAGVPVVNNTSVEQDHSLTADAIATGSPSIADSTITQVHDLSCNNIECGAPTIEETSIEQDHAFVATDIIVNAPDVSVAAIAINQKDLVADDLVGSAPELGSPTFSISYALTASGIEAGSPEIPSLIYDAGIPLGLSPSTDARNSVDLAKSINFAELTNSGINSIS